MNKVFPVRCGVRFGEWAVFSKAARFVKNNIYATMENARNVTAKAVQIRLFLGEEPGDKRVGVTMA